MSSRHGNSRRQAYGRRMKDLRTRHSADLEIDLEGPRDWSRGGAWDDDGPLPRASMSVDRNAHSVRAR
jgi:hypothetical protein